MDACYRPLADISLKLFILMSFLVVIGLSPANSNQLKVTGNKDSPNARGLLFCDLYGQVGLGYYVQIFVGQPHQLVCIFGFYIYEISVMRRVDNFLDCMALSPLVLTRLFI